VHSWALREHLIPYFGRRRLDQITVDDVAAYIAAMRRKGLRGSTILTTLRPLSRILAHAARRGAIPVNPCSQLERGERPRLDDQRPKRILTLEEMHALLDACECEHYRCLLELLLTSGLRIGEALGLCVGDLDQRHAVIRVECQLGRDGERTPLKTEESRRAIDIPPRLMQRLVALVRERGTLDDPTAFVFASRNGTGLVRKVARGALDRASRAAGLATPKPSLHDLRHSHASMLIALDTPVVDVQHRLGHRKPDTTLRVYAHQWKEREARRSQIGQQLGALFHPDRNSQPTRRRSGSPSHPHPTMPDRHGFNHLGDDVRCIDCPTGGPLGHWPEHKRARHAHTHERNATSGANDLRRQRPLLTAPPTPSNEEKEATMPTTKQAKKGASAKQVAIDVLRQAGGPLHASEIAKRVLASGRCAGLKGKTPEATISAMLAVGSKPGGPFSRVDKGTYTLADAPAAATASANTGKSAAAARTTAARSKTKSTNARKGRAAKRTR
jgi:integrase